MSASAPAATPLKDLKLRDIEQFLFQEVRLALFTDDAEYWVPLNAEQSDPWEHLSVMYETKPTLQLRCQRYSHSRAHSQQPPSRTSHLVSNVMLDHYNSAAGTCVANAQFQVREFRDKMRIDWAGTFNYELEVADSGFCIKRKKVLLVDSEGDLETIHIPF